MMRGKEMSGRLSQFAVAAVMAGLTCCGLHAQQAPSPSQVYNTPAHPPVAPIGTAFKTVSGGTVLTRHDTRVEQTVGPNYRIGADDVLTIDVWHQPEVSRKVPVRPDGKISLPLLGDVQAAGLTPEELQNELKARFTKYMVGPDVSVIVTEIHSLRINVLGQVLRPGTYSLIPPMSVIDAIATAGGLTVFAKPNKIYVLRTFPNGQEERLQFAYKNALKGKKGSNNILLQTRDTVVVP